MKKIISVVVFVFVGIIVSAQTDSVSIAKRDSSKVLTFAEVMPMFPGEPGAFQKYLQENIKYPKEERAANKQGTVYVRFVVEADGSISNIGIVKSVAGAPGLSEEAIRVISQMPNWIPGEMNGRKVRVEITQPIKFVLQGKVKKQKEKKL